MNFVGAAILYLVVFRLAIVVAGIISVVLGYKLLCRGIGLAKGSGESSTIEGSAVGVRFSVKNAAPGTAFALFGATLLVVMLVQSSPSVTLETLSRWQAKVHEGAQTENSDSERLIMRGSEQDQNSIWFLTAQGIEYEKGGDTANAERAYGKAVALMAEPMNDLAWIYLSTGRAKDAVGLAALAVQLRPSEPRFADTLRKAHAATR